MLIKVVCAGIAIWILRMATAIAFLDDSGRLNVVLDEGRLPGNVEYFFTALMAVYVIGPILAAIWILRRIEKNRVAHAGVVLGVGLVAVFLVLDAMLEVAVADRGWAHHFRNVVLDYFPLLIIPASIGWLVAARQE